MRPSSLEIYGNATSYCWHKHLVEGTICPGHVRNSLISVFIAFLNIYHQADIICITISLNLLIIDRKKNRQISTGSNVGLVLWVHAEPGSDANNTPLLLYKKRGGGVKLIYLYKKPDTSQKARQFAYRFYSQKARHFTSRNFSWNCWNWHLYKSKKHYTLRYMTFIYTKTRHLKKGKTNCVTFFYIQKSWHFGFCRFCEIFEICRGGGHFYQPYRHE